MSLPFEYVFPAIRGIQAGREYYVSMCPVRLIPKLFSFDDEEIPPEMRAQRRLNTSRVPEIAKYILENQTTYTFSAITTSIDADITFEPVDSKAEDQKIGRLRVPMDARFIINDGQHRRAAFEIALKENPEIGYETIAVVFFMDIGLKRSQQMFTDLNRYAAHPTSSLNILYDHRDKKAILAREIVQRVNVFRTLTDMERSNLPKRSSKLFTLSSIYSASNALLTQHKDQDLEQQIQLAVSYWEAVSTYISDWEQVLQRQVSAGEIRQNYIHSHGIALAGLGGAGTTLISIYPETWKEHLEGLKQIDWLRSNPEWEGRIMLEGRISKSRPSVRFLTVHIKKHLALPLTSEEEGIEHSHSLVKKQNNQ